MTTKLPPGWAKARLVDLIAVDGLFSDGDWVESKDQDPEGDVRLVQLADVGDGLFRDRSNRSLAATKADNLRCTYLAPGDILVARMPEPLGRACIYPGANRRAVTAVDVCIVRPGSSGVNPRWLMWIINSPRVRREISSYQTGTTRKRISRSNLSKIELPIPPSAEQMRIVAALEGYISRIDSALAGVHAVRARLDRLEVSRLWQLTHEVGDKRVRVQLSDIADVRLGRQRSPKNHHGDSMRPYLRAANVGWSGLRLEDIKRMNFTDREVQTYELLVGDIVLSEASGSAREVGKPAMWNGEVPGCCFQNTLIRVRPRSDHSAFLTSYLRAEAKAGRFAAKVRGVGLYHLGAAQLSRWPVDLPGYAVQESIAEEVSSAEAAFGRIRNAIADILGRAVSLRQALLSCALEGRLVSQDPNDEPAEVLLERIRQEREAQPKQRRGRRTVSVPQEEALL